MTRAEKRMAARHTLAQKLLEIQVASILSLIIPKQAEGILEDSSSSFTKKSLVDFAHQVFGLFKGSETQASTGFKSLAKKAKTFGGDSSILKKVYEILSEFEDNPEFTYYKTLNFASYLLEPEVLSQCISNSIKRHQSAMCGELGTLYETSKIAYR